MDIFYSILINWRLFNLFSIAIESPMLKKRAESKKKKTNTSSYKNLKAPLVEKSGNFLFKFTEILLSPKASTAMKLKQTAKVPKSSNITPSNKSRKASKENLFQSVFYSKKSSEVSTPFHNDYEDSLIKSRCNFRFLHQIGSGGFGRVWKVEDKKTSAIYAMKEMSKAK